MSSYTSIVLVIFTAILFLFFWLKKKFSYFERHRVPHLKPNLIFGNLTDAILLRTSLSELYRDFYEKLAPHKFAGFYSFTSPKIILRDPELIRQILIKDFANFQDRGINVNTEVEPLSNHLANLKGDAWKNLRIKLTSTFTASKMKMMFPLVKNFGAKLEKVLNEVGPDEPLNVKDLNLRFTNDIIGTCAFGLELGSLDDPESEFYQMSKKIFDFRFALVLRGLWPSMPSSLIKMLRLTILHDSVQNFFTDIVTKTVKYREENKVSRSDYLDLLIAMKNNTYEESSLNSKDGEDLKNFLTQIGEKKTTSNLEMTDDLLAAQCFIFFLAGLETSSVTLAFILFELALNPDIQEKLRDEIHTVLENNNGEITYDMLKEMTYMDLVMSETMRKYPSASYLLREAKENYKIPGTNLVVPPTTSFVVSIFGLHMDPNYYDNPEEFRPERFTEAEKAKRPNYTYLPFGDGPRICIGERFAIMQIKTGLIYFLNKFSYRISPRMKFPLEYEKNFGLLTVPDGIWLQCEKL